MSDLLIEEAKELGGVVNPYQGNLYVRVPVKGEQHKFWILSFCFSSWQELGELFKRCKDKGFQPFTDVIDLKVSGTNVTLPKQEQGPSCPYHGDEFVGVSKRKPGSLYCKAKLMDGTFCKWEG